MNRTLCGLGIPCPKTAIINADFFSILQTMPLTIYTGGAKGVDTHVEHICHKYGHLCVVFIPPCHPRAKSLAPLTQPDLDAAMPMVTRAAFQLGHYKPQARFSGDCDVQRRNLRIFLKGEAPSLLF